MDRARQALASAVDAIAETTVAPSFSRVGIGTRRRLEGWVDPPRMDGRVALVTGATSGIGLAAAMALAGLGAEVHLVGRDPTRGATAFDLVEACGPGRARLHLVDLSDPTAVAAFGRDLADRVVRLDALVHNAGALTRTYQTTSEGVERTLATHVLGPYLLTAALAPLLFAPARGTDEAIGTPATIVTMSSGGMYSQPFDLAALEAGPGGYDGVVAYARAKRAQLVLAQAWASRFAPVPVASYAAHPGWVDTPGLAEGLPRFARLMRPLLRTPAEGADTAVWLAAGGPTVAARAAGTEPITSGFFHDRHPRSDHRFPVTHPSGPGDPERLLAWCASAHRHRDARARSQAMSDPVIGAGRSGGGSSTAPMSRIAIAGASGYVGRLLATRLAGAGHQVSALGRQPQTLPSGARICPVTVDVADAESTAHALAGADAAYYLVHAMAGGDGFEARDRELAEAFGAAARSAGVGRIIYLGALGHGDLSAHLVSRQQVGEVLAASGVPVVELRAAVILGAGSISYEMLRSLTERLPVMVCPRWITTRLQPLAERDLLDYLAGSLVAPPGIYEIGTPDVTDYGTMMRTYAEARGLRPRRIFTVPFVTPSLSARWVDLVSPVDRRISHALIESLVNEVLVHDPARTFDAFGITPLPVGEAVRRAISDEGDRVSAGLLDRSQPLGTGVYIMRSAARLEPDRVAAAQADLAQVGGNLAWYGVAWAWALRVVLGRLFGEKLRTQRPDVVGPGRARRLVAGGAG